MTPMAWVVGVGGAAAAVPAGLRWLRVAQREHYLAGSASRFALRWWTKTGPANAAMAVAGAAGAVSCGAFPPLGLAAEVVAAAGPLGLSVKGRSKPLDWTRRMRVLAATWGGCQVGFSALGVALASQNVAFGLAVCAAAPMASPLLVDLAMVLTTPLERRGGKRWVDKAAARLAGMDTVVVGVTGSYGKTTTKGYVAHLCSGARSVVASPASFNNALGLARTVNDHLPSGTQVLVAEMGAYRKGEIARLCSWMHPQVGILTALGPVHLERFGSEEAIAEAKSELAQAAPVVVINVAHPALARVAKASEAAGKRVWTCSGNADSDASVVVTGGANRAKVRVRPPKGAPCGTEERTETIGAIGGAPTNVACAIAAALELGVDWETVLARLPTLPTASHRLEAQQGSTGAVVLDDTYNSNPAGARFALEALERAATPGGRRVLVTPGMVELGSRQAEENAALGEVAAKICTDIVVVARTNRAALRAGIARSSSDVNLVEVPTRQDAVGWVRSQLGPGDAVLYENDLPDHFP